MSPYPSPRCLVLGVLRVLGVIGLLGGCRKSETPSVPLRPPPVPALLVTPPAPPPPSTCPDVSAFVASLPTDGHVAPTFLDVAAGFNQSCAITPTHDVVCWGTTWTTHRYLPEEVAWKALPITLPKRFVPIEIDAGDSGGCVRGRDATVACWGTPRPHDNRRTFRDAARVSRVAGATSISVGHRGACAVTKRGQVWCWGEGWHHDLGRTAGADPAEDAIRIPGITNAVEVAVDQQRACARLATGKVTCWGNGNLPTELGGISDAIAIDVLRERACAARATGAVVCWDKVAEQPSSRLVHDSPLPLPPGDPMAVPHRVAPTGVPVAGITGAVDVALGDQDCVRSAAGRVTCWASGRTTSTVTYAFTNPAPAIAATRLSGGTNHHCILDASGAASCWGNDEARQLGARVRLASPTPVEMCGVSDVVEVGTGTAFTCVRQRSGAILCAGSNREGTLERSYLGVSGAPRLTPITNALSLSVGPNHSCVTRPNNSVHCWGKAEPAPGLPATGLYPGSNSIPVDKLTSVAAGRWLDCALLSDGDVTCWRIMGAAASPWENLVAPLRVSAVAAAQELVGMCALEKSGRVLCWGDDFVKSQIPTTGTDAIAHWWQLHPPENSARVVWPHARLLAVGDGAACAIVDDSVRCEGLAALSVPASLATNVADVQRLAVGGGRACVLRGGAIDCWTFSETTPSLVRVPGLDDATSISVSRTHACAIRRGGTVACWGADERGQLGAGPAPRAPTAVRVDK